MTKRFFSVRHDFLPKTTSKRHVWYPKIFKTTWFPTSFKPLIFLGVGVKRSFLLTNNLLIRKIYEKITFLLTSHQICKFQPSIYTKNQDHWTQRYNTVIAVKVIFFVVGSTTYVSTVTILANALEFRLCTTWFNKCVNNQVSNEGLLHIIVFTDGPWKSMRESST